MDYTQLIEWEFTDDNKLIGKYNMCYILIRKLNSINPYELRIFKNGEILFFISFDNINKATRFAQGIVDAYYYLKKPIKKCNNHIDNNIVYIKKWRESHGSKK